MTDILTSDMTSEEQEAKAVLERARLERLRTWLWRCAPIWAGGEDVIKFTVKPSGNRMLLLYDVTPPVDCVVDWGDGARDAFTERSQYMSVSHTYADTTPRTVTITGALGGFWHNTNKISTYTDAVTSVDRIASKSLVSLKNTFMGCTNLVSLPARIDAPNLADCDKAFYQCKSITGALPPLWKTHPKASHVDTFTQCFASSLSLWTKYGKACPHALCSENVSVYEYFERAAAEGFSLSRCRNNSNTDAAQFRSGDCLAYQKATRCSASVCKEKIATTSKCDVYVSCLATRGICYRGGFINVNCSMPNEDVAHPSWAEARAAGWL